MHEKRFCLGYRINDNLFVLCTNIIKAYCIRTEIQRQANNFIERLENAVKSEFFPKTLNKITDKIISLIRTVSFFDNENTNYVFKITDPLPILFSYNDALNFQNNNNQVRERFDIQSGIQLLIIQPDSIKNYMPCLPKSDKIVMVDNFLGHFDAWIERKSHLRKIYIN